VAALAAVVFPAAALGIRVLTGTGLHGTGLLEQGSGTALSASTVYAGVLLLRPTLTPVRAGLLAVGFSWLIEFLQLTGVPAHLSARSLAARLVLGVQFDVADLLWYVVGVVPLVAVHKLIVSRPSRAECFGGGEAGGVVGRVAGGQDTGECAAGERGAYRGER